MHACTSVAETIRFASKFPFSPHCTPPPLHTGGFYLSPQLLQENTFLESFQVHLSCRPWSLYPAQGGTPLGGSGQEPRRSQALLCGPRVSRQNRFPAGNPAQRPTALGTRASGPAPDRGQGLQRSLPSPRPAQGQPRPWRLQLGFRSSVLRFV